MNNIEMDATEVFANIEKIKDIEPGAIQTYFKGLVPEILAFAIQVLLAFVVYLIGVQVIRFIRKCLKKGLERKEADIGLRQFLDALAKYICYFILVAMILSIFGIATTSAVAVLGSVGLTVGLALQGSLSNFAGGVLILLLRPFKVGDYIIEDSHKNEGTVTEISVFYTKLKTVDNKVIIIPNGTLANSSLTNVTHSDKRRVDLSVGISYQADLKVAKSVILALLEAEPNRLSDEQPAVFVAELTENCVKIGANVWVASEHYWETKCRLIEEMKLSLDKNHIDIAFPQMEVRMKE